MLPLLYLIPALLEVLQLAAVGAINLVFSANWREKMVPEEFCFFKSAALLTGSVFVWKSDALLSLN